MSATVIILVAIVIIIVIAIALIVIGYRMRSEKGLLLSERLAELTSQEEMKARMAGDSTTDAPPPDVKKKER